MKCVRIVGQGVPVLLSDDDARRIVEVYHDGEYCKRQFWKDWYDRVGADRYRGRLDCSGRILERVA